jgi:hypothetical protein
MLRRAGNPAARILWPISDQMHMIRGPGGNDLPARMSDWMDLCLDLTGDR